MKTYLILLISLTASLTFGQVQSYFVTPVQTDAAYAIDQDSSTISINTGTQQNKLYLFIGGTGSSSSSDYNAVRLHAADLGFHFINLSYPNDVAAASLAGDPDALAFDHFRQEICFGTPVSDDVNVDTLNSVYTRTLKLVQYLNATHTSENWGQFLALPSALDWSKIIVGGHSQGSGHAAYLAKQFDVDRVLMFSGPNDYSDFFSGPANWITQPGTTSLFRHFSYLSLNDEIVDYAKQHANNAGLGMHINDDSTYVDNLASPYTNSHCLYTTQAPGIIILNHNVTVKLSTINNDVWTYMLTDPNVTDLENNSLDATLQVYPNPVANQLTISGKYSQSDLHDLHFYTLQGHQIALTTSPKLHQGQITVDISSFEPGMYIIELNGQALRILKQ